MTMDDAWAQLAAAVAFAVERIEHDPDPLNEREAADGHQYVMRILTAVSESSLLTFDPERPAFLPMLESVRHLGAAGPDIDYDVALVLPDTPYRVTGTRGGATFVGITVYGTTTDTGAVRIVDSVDVDDLAAPDGTFTYELSHPDAARVIVRQYFHDRATQARGRWTIDPVHPTASAEATRPAPAPVRPAVVGVEARVANAARSIRWNAQLNRLWTPERRATPNTFVRQTPDDIAAAIPNPDVMYSFTWWHVPAGQALVVELTPPATDYWALQVCDRWFQCFPDRRTNLNDRQVVPEADGSVRLVLADGDPGHPNWLDTSGHHVGTMFFRWLHADPADQPRCHLVPTADVPALARTFP
jgi:hypothetical protein